MTTERTSGTAAMDDFDDMDDMSDDFDQHETDRDAADNTEQILTFYTGGILCGISAGRVKEVIEYGRVFKIPLTPEYISGVINLRGDVVSVISLNSRFGLEESDITKFSCIVIIDAGAHDGRLSLGIVIDSIRAVADIASIQPAPGFGSKIRNDFISGIGKFNDEFITILNMDMVLNMEELSDYGAI